jgi:hypothetical protein
MKLQTLRENIVKDLKVNEVFDYLLSRGVLSEDDMQRIKGEVSLEMHQTCLTFTHFGSRKNKRMLTNTFIRRCSETNVM